MSRGAWQIDPWAFARTSGRRDGAIGPSELPRLSDAIALSNGVFVVSTGGRVAEDKRSYIHVKISGVVWLTCQRCLDLVQHVVRHDVAFQLWPTGVALPDDELFEDSFDALPAGNELDLAQLVEDEVLLGLPLSPRHADCQLPGAESSAAEESPFDVLKELKRPH